jgi:uncharacterized protein (DUF1330 family)
MILEPIEEETMAAYIIVQVDVTDPEIYETYRQQVPPTLEMFGGEFIVRGGDMTVLEGEWLWPRCVVLRFPDMASAKAWHDSEVYAGPKALRQSASQGNMIVVEGA